MGFHVAFVTCDDYYYIFVVGMVLKLGDPLLDFLEGFAGDNLIHNHSTYSISVVDWRDCIVKLLTSGVPDGEFYIFIIMVGQLKILLQIAGIDGRGLIIVELISRVFEGHGSFAHST
jgi:hypothetical protein